MKKLILCIILMSFGGLAFAGARVQIPVNQSIVAPQASSKISLKSLRQNVVYNIICNVASSHEDTYITMQPEGFNYDYQLMYIINGNMSGSQAKLPKGDNTLEVLGYMRDDYYYYYDDDDEAALIINNIDNDGTLVIKQCYANPSVAMK